MPAGRCLVKKPTDISAVAAVLQRSGATSAFIRRFPMFGAPIRLLNPGADMADEVISRHVIAHSVLREERATATMAALALVQRSTPISKLFDISDTGRVNLVTKTGNKLTSIHVNDLLEGNTRKRFKLTPEQLKGIELRKDIWDDLRFYYNQYGGKLNVEDDLYPRAVAGWVDPLTGKLHKGDGMPAKSRYGGSPLTVAGSFSRARATNADGSVRSSGQMTDEGWRYLDPDEILTMKGMEIARRTADAQFAGWLKTQPGIKKKADILGPGVKTGVHEGRWGMVGFDGAETPALAGYYADAKTVTYINNLMSMENKAVIPGVTWLVNESRGAVASMDFGTTGVQLLMSLGADSGHLIGWAVSGGKLSKPSNIFARAVTGSFGAWFSPKYLTNYYAENKDIIDRWSLHIGALKNSDFSSFLRETDSSLVAKVPLMVRFARAFEASLDIAKIEYIKSLEKIFGGKIPASEMEKLGAWVRNSTGTTSTSRMGVSPRQQDIEATWLFFSPRFTRSLFAMTATVFKNDVAGHEARLALGGFAAAATTLYLTAAYALGQEPDLRPTKNGSFNADFFTLRVGDNRVGVGGGMRALSRLMVESYESAKDDPSRFISLEFRGADSNPFLAFWRSRTAPLTGTAIDVWAGEDFKGTPIEDGNDWANVVKGRLLPFSVQAALEAKGQADTKGGLGIIAGFGMNTSPISAYQLYNEYLLDQRTARGEPRFPDGANTVHTDKNDFKNFLVYDPQAKILREEYETTRLEGGSPGRDIQKILNLRVERLTAADKQLDESGDYRRYREQVNTIRADSRTTMATLHLDSIRSKGDKAVVSEWYDIYADPAAIDPITGGINSDGLEALQDRWMRENPGEYERLIEPSESIGSTPHETELRTDRKTIAEAGWWDTNDTSWGYLKELLNARTKSDLRINQYASYEEYQLGRRAQYLEQFTKAGRAQPQLLADIAMQRDPLVGAFNKIRTRERITMQRDNPELISILEKWGYNHVSLAEYGLAVAHANRRGYIEPQ